MFKRIKYRAIYKQINKAAQKQDWQTALSLAKQIQDKELQGAFALARCAQILHEIDEG